MAVAKSDMITVVFDTETTSLIHNSSLPIHSQPRVIEFFANKISAAGKVVDELEFICDPGIPISEEINRITGLSGTDVQGQPPFSAFADDVIAFFKGANAVVAHNLGYDFQVVNVELLRLNKSMSWPVRMICTVQETEWYKGYPLNLGALHEHLFGEKFVGAHRARVDVQALTRCFLELRKRGDV